MAFLEHEIYRVGHQIRSKEEFLDAMSVLLTDIPELTAYEDNATPYNSQYNVGLLQYIDSMRAYAEAKVEDKAELTWTEVFDLLVAAIIYE